jgi:hypothetical protein
MAKSDEKDKGTSKSRRGFLKKAGTAAVLLPPAMAVLSKPSRAKMVRSATGGGDHHDYPNMKKKVPMTKKKVAKKKVAKKKVTAKKKVARKVQPS